MAKAKPMKDKDVETAVGGQIDQSRSFDNERAKHRDWALRFMDGEVDFDPMGKDRSSVVSRDVSDMHGLIMPGLMRTFFGSDKIVEYSPKREHINPETGEDDSEERCSQAADLVNYIFLRECNGYRETRSAVSDGLVIGNGIVKHWWDATPDKKTETYSGLGQAEYDRLIAEPGITQNSIEVESYPDPDWTPPEIPPLPPNAPPEMAMLAQQMQQAQPPLKYDVTLERIRSKGRVRYMGVPDDEFLMGRDDIVLDETTRFCGHRQRVTRSDLIKEGFARDKVDAIPAFASTDDSRQYRDKLMSGLPGKAADKSTELVERVECYVLLDVDGDGIAERRKVVMAGSAGAYGMLANEEWGDDVPFSDLVPDPRPFMWRGRGLYETVGDVQRVKTVGIRGLLDNTYQQLVPQEDIVIGAYANMDEIYEPTFGGVRLRNPGFEAAVPRTIPFIGDKVFPLLEYMDAVSEKRTGVSRASAALDPDVLQNQTAEAARNIQSAAMSKVEEMARNLAEVGGFKRIFSCLYRLVVKHQDEAKAIRLRGKWVKITPQGWDEDVDVTVNTGLGTGSRERDMAMLSGVLGIQKEAVAALGGPLNPVLNISHLFDTARKMAEASGLNSPETYFPDLSQDDVTKMREEQASKPPPPSPAMMEAQAKSQLAQQQAQFTFQMEQRKAAFQQQLDREKADRDAQNEVLKGQRSAETEKAQAEADMAVQRQKMEYERQSAQMQFEFDKQLKLLEFRLEAWKTMQGTAMTQGAGLPTMLPPDLLGDENPMGAEIAPELMQSVQVPPTPLEQSLQALIETGRQQLAGMQQHSETLAQGLGAMAQAHTHLAAAIAAPKTVTTPSGQTYTARTGMN